MGYRLDHGWPGGSVGRAAVGSLAGAVGGSGQLGNDAGARSGIIYGTCQGVTAAGEAYVLLGGGSAVLALQVGASIPLVLLVSRRVAVAGDDPTTWLVVGAFGT